jgi:PAS domain S-box-containing protein
MMTNLDGKIIYANKCLAEMHGYKLTELAGKSWDVFYNPFQWKQIEELNKSLLNNGSYDAIEVRHTHKNGNSFPTLMSAQLMQNKNDNSQFITATIIDISDQKKAEEKLIAAQKMDSIGNLAGGIAHDFNNMLGGISGYASILVAETNVDKHKEYAETIINITEKANDLTKRLLSFGKKSFKAKVNLNINQAVEEILLIIKHSFDKNIKIKIKLNKQIYQIAADPTQINQVIMNLCVNAFEAMPTGGLLKIATDNVMIDRRKQINYANQNNGNNVMIHISEN